MAESCSSGCRPSIPEASVLISGSDILDPLLLLDNVRAILTLSGWGDTNQLQACQRAAEENCIVTMLLES